MKANKHLYTLLAILFIAIGTLQAQRSTPFSVENFKKKRAEYLKQELKLTPQEYTLFIPLSEELMDKKFELSKEARLHIRALKKKEQPTEQDYEKAIGLHLQQRIDEALLEKEYVEKFKQVLPIDKVFQYFDADMKFIRNMMDKRGRQKNKLTSPITKQKNNEQ